MADQDVDANDLSDGTGQGKEDPTTAEVENIPKPKAIEIERKFVVTENSKAKLKEFGAELLNTVTFTDKYFDDEKNTLTTQDVWLRQRDQCWELKRGLVKKGPQVTSTQYLELDSEDAILENISSILKDDPGDRSLADFLVENGCREFSCYTTQRQSYSLDGLTIVLDEMDFGYCIGEIEMMVLDEAGIPDALKAIDLMADKLGFAERRKVPGKMDAYLRKNRPDHYRALLNAKIMFDHSAS